MQFFILMVDFGKGPQRPMGFEATVNPELTRNNIIDQVREIIQDPRGRSVEFVKFVDGDDMTDVTLEILAIAGALEFEEDRTRAMATAFAWDHQRDLAKHEVA